MHLNHVSIVYDRRSALYGHPAGKHSFVWFCVCSFKLFDFRTNIHIYIYMYIYNNAYISVVNKVHKKLRENRRIWKDFRAKWASWIYHKLINFWLDEIIGNIKQMRFVFFIWRYYYDDYYYCYYCTTVFGWNQLLWYITNFLLGNG